MSSLRCAVDRMSQPPEMGAFVLLTARTCFRQGLSLWRWLSLPNSMCIPNGQNRSPPVSSLSIVADDPYNRPVPRATLTGDWSGAYYSEKGVRRTTGHDGRASFKSQWSSGTFMFTVTDVSKSGWTYDPSKNKETSDSAGQGPLIGLLQFHKAGSHLTDCLLQYPRSMNGTM